VKKSDYKEHLYQISIMTFILLLPLWNVTVINFSETGVLKLSINFILVITEMIIAYKFIKSLKNTKLYSFFEFCGVFSFEIYINFSFLALITIQILQVHLWLEGGIIAILSRTLVYVVLSIVIVLKLSYKKNISFRLFGRSGHCQYQSKNMILSNNYLSEVPRSRAAWHLIL